MAILVSGDFFFSNKSSSFHSYDRKGGGGFSISDFKKY